MAEPQNKSNTGIIIGAVVVIVIALGWYFYSGSSDAPVEPSVVETPTTEVPPAVEPDAPIATDPAPAGEMPEESAAPDMDDTAPSAD